MLTSNIHVHNDCDLTVVHTFSKMVCCQGRKWTLDGLAYRISRKTNIFIRKCPPNLAEKKTKTKQRDTKRIIEEKDQTKNKGKENKKTKQKKQHAAHTHKNKESFLITSSFSFVSD